MTWKLLISVFFVNKYPQKKSLQSRKMKDLLNQNRHCFSRFKPSGFRENNENSFFERNIEKKNYLTLHFNI